MPTVQFKLVRAWMGACILAGALSAIADDAAKPAFRPSSKGVTIKTSAGTTIKPAYGKPATAKAAQGSGRMQVEEPKASAPISDARASKAWQKTHAKGLTEEQKQAFKDRKEGMETLIAVIKAKRKALHDAKPEERAAITRELHSLILEKDEGGAVTAAARVEASAAVGNDAKAPKASPVPDAAAAKAEERTMRREEYRRQQLEKMKQWKSKSKEED